jgi:hypothetical protein
MRPDIESEKAIRDYLLGELSEPEQQRLEERLLVDDDYFQQLQVVEEELIDDYISGELPTRERLKFDSHFLAAPERQQDLRFAQALRKYVSASGVEKAPAKVKDSQRASLLTTLWASLRPRSPLVGFSVAAILVLVVGGLWLINRQSRQPSSPDVAQTQPTTQPIAQQPDANNQPTNNAQPEINNQANSAQGLPDKTKQPQQTPEPPSKIEKRNSSVFAIALMSGGTRAGGETKRVKIPRETGSVELRLELNPGADDYQSYQAVLQTSAGQDILNKSGLQAGETSAGKIINWRVPANLLKAEDYYLKLSGRNSDGQYESAGAYSFRVIEK